MRQAIVEMSPELLRDGLGPLFDAGLTVEGSLEAPAWRWPIVALVISGDALPAECDGPGPTKVVLIEVTSEAYGRQRITRVSGMRLTGQTAADYVARPLDRVA